MKRIALLVSSFASIVALSSCNIFATHYWSWEDSTAGDTIKYCLLIGQLDHNDSMDRTRGVREELNTRDLEHKLKNYNLEEPIEGEITLGGTEIIEGVSKTAPEKVFKVKEIEHGEQKSLAGATWDPITANSSAGTWIAAHGKNITMFVSNNDGMAEGAVRAGNWYQGMPIFGYDANTSTLKLIRKDKIMGTIDSNTPTQCLTSAMLIRNIVDATKKDSSTGESRVDRIYEGKEEFGGVTKIGNMYDPTKEGFSEDSPNKNYGYVTSEIKFDECQDEYLDADANHAVLVKNNAITKFDFTPSEEYGVRKDVEDYFNGDRLKTTNERIEDGEPNVHGFTGTGTKSTIDVWQSYYSNSDVYFTSNMQPFFDVFQPMLDLKVTPFQGDGTEEKKCLDALKTVLSSGKVPQAFLINTVKQPNAKEYVKIIAESLKLEEKENWIDRNDIPIIFWNRQPTNEEGEVSKQEVMHNKFFKYTYYVGFGASDGGNLQGEMVRAWLNHTYIMNYK